jgi:hypothetical protein
MNCILEISNPAHLRCQHSCLVVKPRAEEKDAPAPPPVTLTTDDVSFILLHHPAITVTAGFLQACVTSKVPCSCATNGTCPAALLLDPQAASAPRAYRPRAGRHFPPRPVVVC